MGASRTDRQRTAEEWFEEGAGAVKLSLSADSRSELREDLDRAVAAFDEAIALDPTHLDALVWRARSLERLDRDEDALPSFLAASRLLPDDHELSLRTARLLVRLGRLAEALDVTEGLRRALPTDPEVAFLRAELLSNLERDREALAAWDELLARDTAPKQGARGRARLMRAIVLARLRDPGAQAAFEQVFDEEQALLRAMFAPPEFFEAVRALPVARDAFRQHLKRRGTRESWEWGAGVWLRAKMPGEAVAAAERMLVFNLSDPRAWYLKAEGHAAAMQREEAINAYREALKIDPKTPGAAARLKVVEGGGR